MLEGPTVTRMTIHHQDCSYSLHPKWWVFERAWWAQNSLAGESRCKFSSALRHRRLWTGCILSPHKSARHIVGAR